MSHLESISTTSVFPLTKSHLSQAAVVPNSLLWHLVLVIGLTREGLDFHVFQSLCGTTLSDFVRSSTGSEKVFSHLVRLYELFQRLVFYT